MNQSQTTSDLRVVLVVGGGVSGLRAAEALRLRGFSGSVRILGNEDVAAYTRPPLSKKVLTEEADDGDLQIRASPRATGLEVLRGRHVREADLTTCSVSLVDGSTMPFDGLVIATGLRARRLDGIGDPGLRHPLRTLADARALRPELVPGRRVVVLGSGVLGCEIASAAVASGCAVTVIGIEAVPMQGPLGTTIGDLVRRAHEELGVEWLLRTTVAEVVRTASGDLVVVTEAGRDIPCDVVVEAVGGVPNVDWLSSSQLDLSSGVAADTWMRATRDGEPLDGVVVAGDVARFPLHGAVRRFEHWDMAVHTGRRAGATLAAHLLGTPLDEAPFHPVPAFWSDQAGLRITAFGLTGGGLRPRRLDEIRGDGVAVGYERDGVLVGAAVIGSNAHTHAVREFVTARWG